MYTDATFGVIGETAELETPNTSFTGPGCLTFYAHMHGKDLGQLNVFIQEDGNSRQIYRLAGDQGQRWVKVQLTVGSRDVEVGMNFSLLFNRTGTNIQRLGNYRECISCKKYGDVRYTFVILSFVSRHSDKICKYKLHSCMDHNEMKKSFWFPLKQ